MIYCYLNHYTAAHNWLLTLVSTVTNTPTVETDVGMIRQCNYRCDRTSVYSFMASPANQDWQTAGPLKRWCIAETSRWAEPAKRLSSCSLCHYDNAPHLVAPQSTRSNNTTEEEHQHYINCEHHQGENWVSRGAEEQRETDWWLAWGEGSHRGPWGACFSICVHLFSLSFSLCLSLTALQPSTASRDGDYRSLHYGATLSFQGRRSRGSETNKEVYLLSVRDPLYLFSAVFPLKTSLSGMSIKQAFCLNVYSAMYIEKQSQL